MATKRLTFTDQADSYKVKDLSDYVLVFLGGNDQLTVNAAAKVTAKMGDGNDAVSFVKAGALVSIDGGAGDDVFGGGHVLLDGIVRGGAGADRFNDFVNAEGHKVVMSGGQGDDVYRLDPLRPATINELAGEGTDLVKIAIGMSYTMPGNVEDLQILPFATVAGAARVYGNALGNHMIGSAAGETIFGGGGGDWIEARAGNDTLWGGSGGDTLDGGAGDDVLHGGPGDDDLRSFEGSDLLIGGGGNDYYFLQHQSSIFNPEIVEDANGGIDTIEGWGIGVVLPANVENGLSSGRYGASVIGNDLDNVLVASINGDPFETSTYVEGGGGNDQISGGGDFCTAYGGLGADHFKGYYGWTFVYKNWQDSTPISRDLYDGFSVGNDVINLHKVDTNANKVGIQHWRPVDGPRGHAQDLWLVHETVDGVASTWVRGDIDGDKLPDFELLIPATITMDSITL